MIIKEFDLNDVFLMSEIIEKMEIQFDIDTIIKKTNATKLENKQDAAELGKDVLLSIGLDLATNLIKRMYKAQKEVKQLIANLTGKTTEEVGRMSLKEMKEFFVALATHEGFGDFLSQVGQ